MSTFLHIDTLWRDREKNPNPAEISLDPSEIGGWFRAARTVRAVPTGGPKMLEFATTLRIIDFTLPYQDEFVALGRVYMDIHSQGYDDGQLISTINSKNAQARFVLTVDRVQYDNLGNPVWIHCHSHMEQVVRIKRDAPLLIRIFGRDNNTLPIVDNQPPLPPNPFSQVLMTLDVRPYIHDNSFSNNLLSVSQIE
jgi:hypothetical protein